jgi:hypothetical integral membrane protein (TIGR02206 family)
VPAPRFILFGTDHVAALAVTALAATAAVLAARRGGRPATAVRWSLAGLLVGGAAAYLIAAGIEGSLTAVDFLPLHLCDAAIFLAAFALVARRPAAGELLYFWAGGGTLLAMVTPDVWYGFPDWRCLSFFGLHGAVVVAAATVTLGLGLGPRPGAPWRAILWTNVYAAVAGLANLALGTNYLFLRAKPAVPTLLDAFGPWPYYLLACEGLALVMFVLLDVPFRLSRRGRVTAR